MLLPLCYNLEATVVHQWISVPTSSHVVPVVTLQAVGGSGSRSGVGNLQMTFSPPALVHSIVAPLAKEFAHSLCRQLSKWLLVCAECQVVGMFMRLCVCVVCAEALVHHCVLKGWCSDRDTEAGVFTIDWTTRVWSFLGPGVWRSCTKGPSTWAAAVRFCYS